ncbi:hypothetical protein [Bifidobacterium aerophilum]|nr:hypothetical protein [Bifidobacterium aerophilum]
MDAMIAMDESAATMLLPILMMISFPLRSGHRPTTLLTDSPTDIFVRIN